MTETQVAPYGAWKSPISSDMIVAGVVGLSSLTLDGEDVYWIEGRPAEGGRYAIARYSRDEQVSDVTPSPFNVRTSVHEYGGGAYLVSEGVELVMAQMAYGWGPEELHFQHPYLTMSQIHSAFAYYWEHKEELDADIERREE